MAANSESSTNGLSGEERCSQFSPNKKLKTLISKGKSKLEDESSLDCCGICLSGEGRSIRGWIDCCDHYFCFVCIMEWAKVESRCPMCKRRFSAIHRPPKDGVFPSERIVNVPIRDQVYHHFGNVTTGPPDPYSEVHCTVCKNTSNESLLLLCDLCDSASHTFCVGLGATVPEGDWFCQDCTLLKEYAKYDEDPDDDNQNDFDSNSDSFTSKDQTIFGNSLKLTPGETPVSIYDIVRDSNLDEVVRTRTRLSSTDVHDDGISVADAIRQQSSQSQFFVQRGVGQLGARTLKHCRNVHGHIRTLRENWYEIRRGYLRFSSNSVDKDGSGQPNSSSCSSQQSTPQNGSSCNILPNTRTQDIDRAWKMMDAAKSIENYRRRTSIVDHALIGSKHSLMKINTSNETNSVRPKVLPSSNVKNKVCGGIYLEKHYCEHNIGNFDNKNKRNVFAKEKPFEVPRIKGYSASLSIGFSELSKSTKAQSPNQEGTMHGNDASIPRIINGVPTCTSLEPVSENNSHPKKELHASSSCNPKEKTMAEDGCAHSNARREHDDRDGADAKSEIQALVKLNLKLLSKDKKLEVVAFKEVARVATHSLLAACGISRPRPGIRSFSSSICSHVGEAKQVRRSTLMPSSCRECFFVFVKDVVNTIMLEKMGNQLSCPS